MAPGSILSTQILSDRSQYELYEVWFNKIDHIHTYGAAKVIMFFSWVFYSRIFSGFSSSMALSFFNWPKDWFWVPKSLHICPNMMYIKFRPKKLGGRCPLAVSKLKMVHTNKIRGSSPGGNFFSFFFGGSTKWEDGSTKWEEGFPAWESKRTTDWPQRHSAKLQYWRCRVMRRGSTQFRALYSKLSRLRQRSGIRKTDRDAATLPEFWLIASWLRKPLAESVTDANLHCDTSERVSRRRIPRRVDHRGGHRLKGKWFMCLCSQCTIY